MYTADQIIQLYQESLKVEEASKKNTNNVELMHDFSVSGRPPLEYKGFKIYCNDTDNCFAHANLFSDAPTETVVSDAVSKFKESLGMKPAKNIRYNGVTFGGFVSFDPKRFNPSFGGTTDEATIKALLKKFVP